jgi:hypothetical protein
LCESTGGFQNVGAEFPERVTGDELIAVGTGKEFSG